MRIGKAATIRMLVQSADQTKIGSFIMLMPGARIFTMVATRLIPESNVPMPAICSAQT